jgi:hypothetical protein
LRVHGTAPAKTRRLPWPVAGLSPACRRGLVPMPAPRWPCRACAAGTVPICTCTRVPARSGAPGGSCGAAAGAAATSGCSRPTTPLAPGRRAFRATSAGSPGDRSAVRLAARTRGRPDARSTSGPRSIDPLDANYRQRGQRRSFAQAAWSTSGAVVACSSCWADRGPAKTSRRCSLARSPSDRTRWGLFPPRSR